MRFLLLLSLCILLTTGLLAPAAEAACPSPYNGDPPNGGSGANICVTTFSGWVVTCDMDDTTVGTSQTAAWFVSPSATEFRAYGVDGDGEQFCVELTVANG